MLSAIPNHNFVRLKIKYYALTPNTTFQGTFPPKGYFMKKFLFLTPLVIGLNACGTIGYEAEKSYCTPLWIEKTPEISQQRITTHYRYELQPTGEFTHELNQNGNSVAVPKYKRVRIPYPVIESFDLNAKRRNSHITACAKRACQVKFGNPACE